MTPYLFARIDERRSALEAQGIDVISLGIGDPDMPTPPHIVNAMAEAVRKPANHRTRITPGRRPIARRAPRTCGTVSALRSTRQAKCLRSSGSKEGIAHLHTAFVDPGDYVLAPSIGYPVYSGGATLANANTYFMPMKEENGFLADFSNVPEDVLSRAKIMFLGYPNNPTGACATEEYFDRAIAFSLEHGLLLAHDNAYCDLCFDGYVAPSILERPHAKECCIEFFSLSKPYNMTGWRIAFACGNREAVQALGTVKNNMDSGQFTAVQEAAIVALTQDQQCVADMCALYRRRRGRRGGGPSLHRLGVHGAEGDDLRVGEGAGRRDARIVRNQALGAGARDSDAGKRLRPRWRRLRAHLADHSRRPPRRGRRPHKGNHVNPSSRLSTGRTRASPLRC